VHFPSLEIDQKIFSAFDKDWRPLHVFRLAGKRGSGARPGTPVIPHECGGIVIIYLQTKILKTESVIKHSSPFGAILR
jgi:hypothetical protein